MNISLPPALEKFIQDKIGSGCYSTASEVVRDGLRMLQEQDRLAQMRLNELRREVQMGIDAIERGEYKTYNREELRELFGQIKRDGRKRLAREKRTARK